MDAHPSPETLVSAATDRFTAIVDAVVGDQLDAPTPCAEYDVGALVGHLLHWGPALVGAGHKEEVPPLVGEEAPAPETWRADLAAHVEALASAWSTPEAWEGTTRMGGPMEMPAATVGGIVLAELVVHGWDLARATGQQPAWPAPLLEVAHAELAAMAEMGRQMGAFGPEVPVPDDAPTLDRLLGVAGRDPAWTP